MDLGFQSLNSKAQDSGVRGENSRIPDSTRKSFPDSEVRITIWRLIALFSLYVLFSQRSKGNLTLCLFLCADHVCTWIRCKLKETVLESIYTWTALENKTYKLKRSVVTYHLDTQQWPAFRCRKLKISLKITYNIQNNQASTIKCNCLMLWAIIIFSMKNVHLKRVLFLGI